MDDERPGWSGHFRRCLRDGRRLESGTRAAEDGNEELAQGLSDRWLGCSFEYEKQVDVAASVT
ncbi:MAG: hypothetical protein J2P57_19760 [Acidimicrobiaceae bacterium]|nr:hypothetical protein [Acidimicrobiaceae bacterium]